MDRLRNKVNSMTAVAGRFKRAAVRKVTPGEINFGYHPSNEEGLQTTMSAPNLRSLSVLEPAPNIDYYRNPMSFKRINRPSLHELHKEKPVKDGILDEFSLDTDKGADKKTAPAGPAVKFGWIIGVFVRCVLNILGAMLYMRLSWIAGQAGIGLASVIICLSSVVTTLTALSMCAICTNGEIKGGGAYYMLSRALGPEFGGSMGLIFSLANALGVGMHIVGFAETVRDLMKENGASIVDAGTNDIRIIGACTLVLCLGIVLMGVDFEVKAQIVLLVILVVSYINYIIGTFIPPSPWKQARGITGYKWSTFSENFVPAWRGEGFFSVFSVYFPAATGIMAGANISGDLKEPGVAIPKGTLLAILATTVTYLGGAWMSASCAIRDASGDMEDLFNGSITACAENGTCTYGIMNYFQTMEMQSGVGPLVTAGIYAATISSALASFVSGPKLLQAVGRDKLFPKLEWFSQGFGKQDEPRRAYFLGFIISLGMILIGDLNIIASYISNFYLATYCLINYACFDGSIAKSPGWRPGFKYYNKWSALLGALLCLACMFLMNWIAALLTFAFIVALYIYLLRKQPDANWGSSTQAHSYRLALKGAVKLLYTEEHVKNYRPQILALTGNPVSRPAMVDFVRCITGKNSLLMFGHVLTTRPDSEYYKSLKLWSNRVYSWLKVRKAKGFYCAVAAQSLQDGVRCLLQAVGVGKLRPNVVIVGFKHDWAGSTSHEIEDYFQMIHESFECGVGVGVLKVAHGFDYSAQLLENAFENEPKLSVTNNSKTWLNNANPAATEAITLDNSLPRKLSVTFASEDEKTLEKAPAFVDPKLIKQANGADSYRPQQSSSGLPEFRLRSHSKIPKEILVRINQFRPKVKKPVIDIWWLFDDGGLTLLIPYLLTQNKSYLANAKLRVFTPSSNLLPADQEQKNLNALLEKFRIKATDVKVITDINKAPNAATVAEFDRLIAPFKISSIDGKENTVFTTDAELAAAKDRTHFHLRTRELLLEYSKNTSLVVVTLPVPRKGGVSACLYLAWLNFLSKDFSPLLFVRGNQQSVLTFYS